MVFNWIPQVDVPAALSLFALVTTPLFWNLRAWNVGCVLYIFWIGGVCLTNGINMLVWREDAINLVPAWCDIYIRFHVASSIGVVSSPLVITHRLYHIINMTATATDFSRAGGDAMSSSISSSGSGIPLLTVALYWFYQGHHFNILEGVGCIEATPNSFLLILLNTAWPLVIVSACHYPVLTLRGVFHRTKDLKRLQVVEPGLSTSRYYRLMALAVADLCFTTPLAMNVLISNVRMGVYPYKGIADLHWDFGRVDSVAAVVWRQDPVSVSVVNFRIWTPIGCAVFFLMFGFTAEARTHYKLALVWVARCLGFDRRAASEVACVSLPPPVADWRLQDSLRDGGLTSKPALAVVENRARAGFLDNDHGELPFAGTPWVSAYCIGRGLVILSPITEMAPAYTTFPP